MVAPWGPAGSSKRVQFPVALNAKGQRDRHFRHRRPRPYFVEVTDLCDSTYDAAIEFQYDHGGRAGPPVARESSSHST